MVAEVGAPEEFSLFSMPNMSRSGGPNFLGARYAPFVVPDDPNSSSFRVGDVTLPSLMKADLNPAKPFAGKLIKCFVSQMKPPMIPCASMNSLPGLELIGSSQAQAAFDIHQEDGRSEPHTDDTPSVSGLCLPDD